MPDALGAGLTLADDLFKWLTNPSGYKQMTLDNQLEAIHEAAEKALVARDYGAVDRLLAELNRLRDKQR